MLLCLVSHVRPCVFFAPSGFIDGAGKILTPLELQNLVLATQTIATELGCRFLTDYLCGDSYFGMSRPQQNLDRADVQLRLAEQLKVNRADLEIVVTEIMATSSQQ